MTAAAFLRAARADIGLAGRPNRITRDYASRHGSEFLRAAWCDMGVTYWARKSGTEAAVLPGGDRAYTVWHAQDFQRIGRWYSGTAANLNKSQPGDVVFFDWGGSNNIGAIDHVGVIEKPLGGGRVQTIEANTGDACRRRVRSASTIAGYGRPAYSTQQQEDEDEMPEYVSVGIDEAQDLPPGTWVTVRWGREYSDHDHHHRDAGGPSILVGPARYSLMVGVRIKGLEPGTELQARVFERPDDDGKPSNGPIGEYTASQGDTFIVHNVAADSVARGSRARFQVIHYGSKTGQIVAGTAKGLVWPTGKR